jgi:hypothetical protein
MFILGTVSWIQTFFHFVEFWITFKEERRVLYPCFTDYPFVPHPRLSGISMRIGVSPLMVEIKV